MRKEVDASIRQAAEYCQGKLLKFYKGCYESIE